MFDIYFGKHIAANPTNGIIVWPSTLEVSFLGWLLVISRRINHEDQSQ